MHLTGPLPKAIFAESKTDFDGSRALLQPRFQGDKMN